MGQLTNQAGSSIHSHSQALTHKEVLLGLVDSPSDVLEMSESPGEAEEENTTHVNKQ